jgi:hypothetical protein
MLPNYETCRKNILAYKRKVKILRSDTTTFPKFWNYKIGLESAGENILDVRNMDETVSLLCGLLKYLKVRNSSVEEISRIKRILRNIRPYYTDIHGVSLGTGNIPAYRSQLESIYERLDGKAAKGDNNDHGLSIVAKSAILMAIWGQVPRFDSLNRIRFEKWLHWPAPEKLPYLTIQQTRYPPYQFRDMVEALDKWILVWPKTNYGKSFENSFVDLCPGIPPGRQIDIIYHWKLPETWIDYRLQSRGSFLAPATDNSIDEYCTD